jgi:hypothetical protein
MQNLVNKSILFTVASLLLLLASCDSAPLQQGSGTKIGFSRGKLTINEVEHRFPLELKDLTEIMGPPDRTTHLENVLSTWDESGIVAYEATAGGPIICLSVSFVHRDYEFAPAKNYFGGLEYEGVALSSDSSPADLIKSGLVQDDVLPFIYSAIQGELEIIVNYDNGLVAFSINH